MLLLDLPHELILDIWDALETTRDMNAFAQTCHYSYDNFNTRLYHYIIHCSDRYSPFHWTAEQGPVETLHKLLKAGVDPLQWDVLSPLDPAARHGRGDLLKVLLEYGFAPNAKDICGQTSLHLAAINGYLECARTLLDAGADLNCSDNDHYTPSACAVSNGHANVLALLLDRGASMDIELLNQETPLGLAARMGFEDLVTFLLDRHAAVDGVSDEMPGTPLAWAARTGRQKIVRQLLEAGADIDASTDSGQGPLHWAALAGRDEVVALLLEEGAAADVPDMYGNTPLSQACMSRSPNERAVERLLAANVNVDARNTEGQTPLSVAAQRGFSRAIRCLLQYSADPTIVDNDGSTPLVIAARNGHAQAVLDLLDDHALSSYSTKHCDTLSEASTSGREGYIDTPDRFNRTPLFLATLYGYEEVVRILLSRGSSAMHFATIAGRTPLSVAQDHSQNATNSKAERINSIWACLRDSSRVDVDLEKVEASSKAAEYHSRDVVCDSCSLEISVYDTHYHCAICNDDNYDMCVECVGGGQTCEDSTHVLQRLRMVDGSWTAVTDDSIEQQAFNIAIR